MEFITDKNPIYHINTSEVKLSISEVNECVKQGINKAFLKTSQPCITKIEFEIFNAIKEAYNRPIISKW